MFINMHDDMSLFYQDMEFVQGDLTDVVRAMVPSGSFKPSNDNIMNASSANFVGSNKFQDLGARDISMSPRQLNPVLAAPRMSAPRSHSVKRRKGQAKKVVCIPAPTPADQERNNSSSSSSVVVPSDHWAWRKYGQKPIKGSPYPRGYYRCSSSKGCLARKQVERSRSDPNMLVVTYTSEHNHPWPTHRNSLAGSTRSSSITKTSINNCSNNNYNNNPASKTSNINTTPKEEEEPLIPNEGIKEESTTTDFDRVFEQKYEPIMMLETNDMEFFSDLGGLDPNPMSFFMSSRDHVMGDINVEEELESKGNLDALSFFDNWDMHD